MIKPSWEERFEKKYIIRDGKMMWKNKETFILEDVFDFIKQTIAEGRAEAVREEKEKIIKALKAMDEYNDDNDNSVSFVISFLKNLK